MDKTSPKIRPVPRCVLIAPYFVMSWLYKPLLKQLGDHHGTRFVVLVPEGTTLEEDYRPFCRPADVFVPVPALMTKVRKGGHGGYEEIFARARANEDRYGLNYTLDIYQQEREIAWGYVPAAKQAGSRARAAPDTSALAAAANGLLEFFEEVFAQHTIDLALVWPRSGAEAACVAVAARRGVPITYPYTGKHKNLAYWAAGPWCGNLQHQLAYAAVGDCAPVEEAMIAPPARRANLEQSRMDDRYSLAGTLAESTRRTLHRAEFLWLDLKAGRLSRSRRRSLYASLRELWADWAFYRRFKRICEHDAGRIAARPFVLFAFQNEPEFSVQARCKEFNDQGAIARQIALSLPVGFNLVIKEHAWIGGRRLSFYNDLVRLPNVIMAHPGIRAIDLIPKAHAVASLTGTVTLEAALYGKPALIFSERSEFVVLPSVRVVSALADMPAVLREVTGDMTEQKRDLYRRGAARMLKAIERIGIEAEPFYAQGDMKVPQTQIDRAIELLRDLLAMHKTERARGGVRVDM